jgi:putative addiction module component (TIGR02574 family)
MALESVLQQALALPANERGELVEALLRSLEEEGSDDPEDEGEISLAWAEAWAAELDRRAKQVDEGRLRLIPHDEVAAWTRARFPSR